MASVAVNTAAGPGVQLEDLPHGRVELRAWSPSFGCVTLSFASSHEWRCFRDAMNAAHEGLRRVNIGSDVP